MVYRADSRAGDRDVLLKTVSDERETAKKTQLRKVGKDMNSVAVAVVSSPKVRGHQVSEVMSCWDL